MAKYRVQKGPWDFPPKTLLFYEDDGTRIKRHEYVNPVRCCNCKYSYVTKDESGALVLACEERTEHLDNNSYCDRGERQ